jgi:hypothetical protein
MSTSWVICNAFLHKCPPQKRADLLNHLTDKEKHSLESLPKTYRDPTQGIEPVSTQLERIHFSWFAPYLRTLSEREIKLFAAALSDSQAAGLKKSLRLSGSLASLTPGAKAYLQNTLMKEVSADIADLLPIECLPDSTLNPLLNLKMADVLILVSFLGLHDLAVEMRHIIETSKLKKISEALTAEELKYVKILMQSREPVSFSRIGLANWQGDKENLKTIIQQRGINRLAKALYGQHPSFIWHFAHKLDSDRGMAVQKLCAPLENVSAAKLLVAQVLELLSFMRKPHE